MIDEVLNDGCLLETKRGCWILYWKLTNIGALLSDKSHMRLSMCGFELKAMDAFGKQIVEDVNRGLPYPLVN